MNKTTRYLLFALLSINTFSGFATTYSHTITASTWTAFGAQTLSGISWTAAGNKGAYFGYDATRGQQFGSSSNPETTLSLTTTGFSQTITSIKVNTSGASSIVGSVAVKVGANSFSSSAGTSQTLSSTATTYTFTGSASGAVTISWTQTSSKAIYLKSIEVTYSDLPPVITPASPTGAYGTAFSYNISATNGPGSFNIISGNLPAGLTLNSSTGAITGTPTETGTFNTTVTATNSSGTSDPAIISITINKGDQVITFAQPDEATDLDQPFTLNGSASSGLALSYASSNSAVATISGSTITITGIGTSDITASQNGNKYYNAATSVIRTLVVKKWVAPVLSLTETTQNTFNANSGSNDEQTFYIAGKNLSDNIVVSLTGSNTNQFNVSQVSIPETTGSAGNTLLTVTYNPTTTGTHTATLKLSSTGASDVTHTLIGTSSVTDDITNSITENKIYYKNSRIYFNAHAGENIELYNSTGQLLMRTQTEQGLNSVQYNGKGVAILKIGNSSFKIII